MEIISKRKLGVVNINLDDFKKEEDLTEKQIKLLEIKNKKFLDNELKKGMVLFRKHFLKQVGGRKNFCKKYNVNWEEFMMENIFFINVEWVDIDRLNGASDYFMSELNNEYTKLTWTSYNAYYDNKKSKNLNKF